VRLAGTRTLGLICEPRIIIDRLDRPLLLSKMQLIRQLVDLVGHDASCVQNAVFKLNFKHFLLIQRLVKVIVLSVCFLDLI
jgi:hypothetical protein